MLLIPETIQVLLDLGIIDDSEYLQRQHDLPEKKNSSVVVNIWDHVSGKLKPAGQKRVPSGILYSGKGHGHNFDENEATEEEAVSSFGKDFIEELFDNDIPRRRPAFNHPVDTSYGVGNKQPTLRPATLRPMSTSTTLRPANFPFSAPIPIRSEMHNTFSRVGTFASPVSQPPRSAQSPSPSAVQVSTYYYL